MNDKHPFSIAKYAVFSCWTSLVLLLWGMILEVIESGWISWFAFSFFLISAVVIAANRR